MTSVATKYHRFTDQLRRRGLTGLLACLVVCVSGCETTPPRATESLQAAATANDGSAESFYIVDCLLPGQVRQLGGSFNYLTQRRPIKTSQSDCEIRGGEYVSFDRADYSTALRIWLPLAKAGDASAQTYVGEIYEKGLGLSADYALAAHWYGEAVKQGYSRAQINLGNLYEKGQGVTQDKQRALNLYRSASGLSEDHLLYASTLSTSYVPRQEHETVQRQLQTEQQRSTDLRRRLGSVSSDLQQQSLALKTAEGELQAAHTELEKAIDAGADSGTVPTSSQALQLRASVQTMDEHQAELKQQLARLQAQNAQLSLDQQTLVEQLSGNERDKSTQQARVEQLEKALLASRERVALSQRELANLTSKMAEQPAANTGQTSELARLQSELDASNKALTSERVSQASLEAQRDTLAEHLATTEARADTYQSRVAEMQRQMAQEEQRMSQTERELAALRDQLRTQSTGSDPASPALDAMQRELEIKDSALTEQRRLHALLLGEKQTLEAQITDSQRSKTSVEAQVATLQDQLSSTHAALAASRTRTDALATKLAEAQRRDQSLTPELQQLQTALNEKNATLAEEKVQLARLESQSRSQQQLLAEAVAELDSASARLSTVESDYAREKARLDNLLGERGAELDEVQHQLLLSRAELQMERAASEQTLGTQQNQLEQLTSRVASQYETVQAQKARIVKLEREASGYENELAGSAQSGGIQETTQIAQLADSGPAIEIIEPPVVLTRSLATVRLQTFQGERQVIGKVSAPSGLLSLSVNGKTPKLTDNNLFRASIPLTKDPTPVEVVLVDNEGRRAAVSFSFIDQQENKTGSASQPIVATSRYDRTNIASDVPMGDYHALVIGNNAYRNFSTLETAGNDARETEKVLREKYGFKTRLLLDANRYTILSAFNELRESLDSNDNLLIYYAGHGKLDDSGEQGYWLPVDADRENTINWISNKAITDILNVIDAKHVLVVADSCYAGTLTQTPIARVQTDIPDDVREEWIKVMAETRARITLTSGGVEPVLDGGGGLHSVFAKAFLDALRQNNGVLEGYSLYAKVLEAMATHASPLAQAQIPQYAPIHLAGHESGEFFFNPD